MGLVSIVEYPDLFAPLKNGGNSYWYTPRDYLALQNLVPEGYVLLGTIGNQRSVRMYVWDEAISTPELFNKLVRLSQTEGALHWIVTPAREYHHFMEVFRRDNFLHFLHLFPSQSNDCSGQAQRI